MIVKLAKRTSASSGFNDEDGKVIASIEGYWVKAIPPYDRTHITILVNGKKYRVANTFVKEIINEERSNHYYCNYCGYIQEGFTEKCPNCKKEGYLHALWPGTIRKNVNEILKGSVTKAFGI